MDNASTRMTLWLAGALDNYTQPLHVLRHAMPISAQVVTPRMRNGAIGTRFVPLNSGVFGADGFRVPIWRERPPDLLV